MTVTMIDYPCHGCVPPKRSIGCHVRCEEFLERKKIDEARYKRKQDNFSMDRVLYGTIKK